MSQQASTIIPTFTLLSQFDELKNVWEQKQANRAEGGLLALDGFEHQFLLTLLKLVRRWREASETERDNSEFIQAVLAEAVSDIAESGFVVTLTQVKRTLSETAVKKSLVQVGESHLPLKHRFHNQ